jgi:hypothetical protein
MTEQCANPHGFLQWLRFGSVAKKKPLSGIPTHKTTFDP